MYRFWVARPALTARAVVLAGLALSLVLSGCAALGAQNQPRTLSVTGTGTVHLPPDVVLITMGVQTRGKDIGATVADNNRVAAAVMAVVGEAGVAAEDIQTTYFNVSTQPLSSRNETQRSRTASNASVEFAATVPPLPELLAIWVFIGLERLEAESYGGENVCCELTSAVEFALL